MVDPVRNIDAYLDKASEFGMVIVGVLETHLYIVRSLSLGDG